ncbi:MAG: phosphonate ABC transporter ATP-binding protein [Comamonadaceae bacterium]|jgi:phosphonate transport system ATP-binding protein|uniref:phosphonate ABC transporter ATP-binding protein n=1 Tax=Hydrogenophaga sp. SNF1 TaxID=3098762 RepID=UPI002ACC05E2|nr:phosphonate ABC transporter ATP-binding protein [Hydrogenophaga sp. SNF1]NCT96451.1 phosphonate ABC transporter ATP-binding protein [Comamonadaceae bacterium]WQB85010.1 phosphonate ABC transporter ATP-binding protein [Hydrogenophaga sp. SNF1]
MTHPVLRAQDLRRTYGTRVALRGVSFDVRRGERVALLGASGSGKSTLIRCLSGLETTDPGTGRIEVFGQALQEGGRHSPRIRALRRRIGVIFQQFNLVGRLGVMSNVLTGLAADTPLWRGLLGRYTLAQRALALDALDTIGLAPQAFQRASTLSGGQQQRAAIARVLVQGAELVLADEPVASLDPQSTRRVMDQLAALNRDAGLTLIVSLHQVSLARRYCHRVLALRDGELVYDGPSAALTPSFLQQLYGTAAEELLHDDHDFAAPAAEAPPLALAA